MATILAEPLLTRLGAAYGLEIDHVGDDLGGFSSQNRQVLLKNGQSVMVKYCVRNQWNPLTIKIASHLAQHSHLIYAPHVTLEGCSTYEIEDQVFAIFPFIAGRKRHGPAFNRESLTSVARALREFHTVATYVNDYAGTHEMGPDFAQQKQIICQSLTALPSAHAISIKKSIDIKRQIIESTKVKRAFDHDVRCHIVHGDFHNENILLRGNDVVAIVDFEMLQFGRVEDDLVVFIILACCNGGFTDENLAKGRIVVEEYQRQCPFSLDIESALLRFIYRNSLSLFFEQMFIDKPEEIYLNIIDRNSNIIPYIAQHHKDIAAQLQGRRSSL